MGVAGEGTQAWHTLGQRSTTELIQPLSAPQNLGTCHVGRTIGRTLQGWQIKQSQHEAFCLSDSGHCHKTLGSVFLSIYKWHLKQRVPWSETGQIGPGHRLFCPVSESPGAGSCEAKEKASKATSMPRTQGAWVSGLDMGVTCSGGVALFSCLRSQDRGSLGLCRQAGAPEPPGRAQLPQAWEPFFG